MIGLLNADVLNLEDLKELKKIKKKHKCSGQLLNILMKAPYLDMEMAGGMPSMKSAREDNKLDSLFLTKEQLDSKP